MTEFKPTLVKLDENDYVINVILAEENFIDNLPDSHMWVSSFQPINFDPKQTFGPELKYNPAGVGMFYDRINNAFIYQQPFPSWSLDENFRWVPPVQKPEDDREFGGDLYYTWNEELKSWEVN